MTEYDFEFHEFKYKDHLSLPNAESRIYYYNEACKSHGYQIFDGLRNISTTIHNKQNIDNEEAKNLLNYGVARRGGMLFYSFQQLFFTIPPDRKNRLSQEEEIHFNGQINLIYLNIKGMLDNLACIYFSEQEDIDLRELPDAKKHLFNKEIINKSNNKEFWGEILAYKEWATNELKMLRDPVAHKMPLYIIPAILNKEEQDLFNTYLSKYYEHLRRGNLDAASTALEATRTIGTFIPWFAHAPNETFSMYPTITRDLGNMLKIFDIIWMELTSK